MLFSPLVRQVRPVYLKLFIVIISIVEFIFLSNLLFAFIKKKILLLLDDFSFFFSLLFNIFCNFLILLFFFLFPLFNNKNGIFITLDNLVVNFRLFQFFPFDFFFLLFLEFLHFLDQYLSFSFLLFFCFESIDLSRLDLINYDLFTLECLNFFLFFDFLLIFDFF